MPDVETAPNDKTKVIDIPEAVGDFDNAEDMKAAFYDLRMLGFRLDEISLLARSEIL